MFVCTWLCFFPKALAAEKGATYSVHALVCTHACMCVYMYMCISVPVLALEPRRMESEWTWQSRLLGMSQTPTCGPSSGPSQSQSSVAQERLMPGAPDGTAASLLVCSAVWAPWEVAEPAGLCGLARGSACLLPPA